MSPVRSRSVSRTKIVKLTDTYESGEALDPQALLSDLIPHVNDFDIPLSVNLNDGKNSVSFLLSVFISKEYEVIDHFVKFGAKKLDIRNLKVNISFDIEVSEDTKENK